MNNEQIHKETTELMKWAEVVAIKSGKTVPGVIAQFHFFKNHICQEIEKAKRLTEEELMRGNSK